MHFRSVIVTPKWLDSDDEEDNEEAPHVRHTGQEHADQAGQTGRHLRRLRPHLEAPERTARAVPEQRLPERSRTSLGAAHRRGLEEEWGDGVR